MVPGSRGGRVCAGPAAEVFPHLMEGTQMSLSAWCAAQRREAHISRVSPRSRACRSASRSRPHPACAPWSPCPCGRRAGRDPLLVDLHQLRHHMAYLVVNLQIYIQVRQGALLFPPVPTQRRMAVPFAHRPLVGGSARAGVGSVGNRSGGGLPGWAQVDVIETNFAQLEQRVAAAQDYGEVERAHAGYLHALMAQCFLTTHTMSRTISTIFRWGPMPLPSFSARRKRPPSFHGRPN